MKNNPPIPQNELERIINLSEMDLDYSDLRESFKDLTRLAATIAGAEISLINLIDSYTQWTIACHGIDMDQMSREDSVCQYTIASENTFEVASLLEDERFCDKFYVIDGPKVNYYFGIPLKSANGTAIGALCILDKEAKELSAEKQESLKIIAGEIVNRLKLLKAVGEQRNQIKDNLEQNKRLLEEVRGPLSGILSLLDVVLEPDSEMQPARIKEYIGLIRNSSSAVLNTINQAIGKTSDSLLTTGLDPDAYNLLLFREKLDRHYSPQARQKKVELYITINPERELVPFSKHLLLPIAGNLIGNAIRSTPEKGVVSVNLDLMVKTHINELVIQIIHKGAEMREDNLDLIFKGAKILTEGTEREIALGFGLTLVKQLVDKLGGTIKVISGASELTFIVNIPQVRL